MQHDGMSTRRYRKDELRDGRYLEAVGKIFRKRLAFAKPSNQQTDCGIVGSVDLDGSPGTIGYREQRGAAGELEVRKLFAPVDNLPAREGVFNAQAIGPVRGSGSRPVPRPDGDQDVAGGVRRGPGIGEDKLRVKLAGQSEQRHSGCKPIPGDEVAAIGGS